MIDVECRCEEDVRAQSQTALHRHAERSEWEFERESSTWPHSNGWAAALTASAHAANEDFCEDTSLSITLQVDCNKIQLVWYCQGITAILWCGTQANVMLA